MQSDYLLNKSSEKIDPIESINIVLKDHQCAIIKKCIEIEDVNICKLGIMSDKPGAGKTYSILGLIYYSQKKPNIIVVPQNIIKQWCDSIHSFSDGLLKYKKFTDYSDILDLYNENSELFNYDILITTPLYYNVIATTMKSNFQCVERVFFDEIDSICSFLINEINANFTWFVSASFDYEELGIYTTKIDRDLLCYITCKCEDSFVDTVFNLDMPNVYKIICKNIYVDNIFNGLFTNEEFKLLNAMDYSKLKKKFYNRIAQNEKEAIEFLVKDKIDIIDIEKLRIDDLNKAIEHCRGFADDRLKILNVQLTKSQKSLEESEYKLNLIRERLKDNNCCPLCYNEFEELQKKVISPCCKNLICFDCTSNWFNNMKKENCIYCNIENVKFEDYVILKPNTEHLCALCDNEYENNDSKYYAKCCGKNSCSECLKDWYQKLLKTECLFCGKDEVLYDDFKNEKGYEEMRINTQSGIKYTKKTKIEFVEYFIKTKIYSQCKIIICSNYIRIFNDIKRLLHKYYISYIELDDGNVNSINNSVLKYTHGSINVLLLNSNLFGCGLNLQCTTDILFLHKTDITLEKQIIGRAQRMGRKDKLNLWYLMHENETAILTQKVKNEIFYNNQTDLELDLDFEEDNFELCTEISIIK
jgi:uncharacterized coiled-coil protein SlyX